VIALIGMFQRIFRLLKIFKQKIRSQSKKWKYK